MIKTFLNPEERQNCISGSKVTAILLKGWILSIGGASALEGLRSTWLRRLVFMMKPFCILFYVLYFTCKTEDFAIRLLQPLVEPCPQ